MSFITTGITLASPLVLGYAIDDLTTEVTRAKLLLYGSALLGIGLVGGVFRFLDAPHPHRRLARPGVRHAQRLLRASADAAALVLTRRTARAT